MEEIHKSQSFWVLHAEYILEEESLIIVRLFDLDGLCFIRFRSLSDEIELGPTDCG